MTDTASRLTPTQQRVADELLALGQERPVADLSWATALAESIDEALDGIVNHSRDRPLWLSKGTISGVLGCEANHLAARDDFEWTPRTARGEIAHRAVALAAAGSDAEPRDLARAAIDQAQRGGTRSMGSWLRGVAETERLALVAEALPGIDGFLTCWPPLKAIWRPVPEYPIAAEIAKGRVKVAGRVDLALGTNRVGSDGFLRRRRMLVELKTGRPNQDHRAEHLFYALLETLKTGVAPFRSATYYLDEGTWVVDEITEELLAIAAARLVDAVRRVVELGEGRQPRRQAGWRCGFCPLADGCKERMAEDAESRG